MNPHFASLVLGLAHQANAAMTGQLPPEVEAQGGVDVLQIAHSLIDTIGMLQEKTEGHLEDDEQELLSETLTALRFQFVKASGSSEVGTGDSS
jgi:hypothetical protein